MSHNHLRQDLQQHLQQQLTLAMQQMQAEGLSKGKSGNMSVRTNTGMLITPTGILPDQLTPEAMVHIDFSGKLIQEGQLKPSSEWPMHAAIYQHRPDTQAISHCHSRFATTLACAGKSIPAFHYMVAVAGGDDIPCTPYAIFGSETLATHTAKALKNRNACLLGNHGQIALGNTLTEALHLAIEVEELAAQYWGTLALGGCQLLGSDEMDEVINQFHHYGQQNS